MIVAARRARAALHLNASPRVERDGAFRRNRLEITRSLAGEPCRPHGGDRRFALVPSSRSECLENARCVFLVSTPCRTRVERERAWWASRRLVVCASRSRRGALPSRRARGNWIVGRVVHLLIVTFSELAELRRERERLGAARVAAVV